MPDGWDHRRTNPPISTAIGGNIPRHNGEYMACYEHRTKLLTMTSWLLTQVSDRR